MQATGSFSLTSPTEIKLFIAVNNQNLVESDRLSADISLCMCFCAGVTWHRQEICNNFVTTIARNPQQISAISTANFHSYSSSKWMGNFLEFNCLLHFDFHGNREDMPCRVEELIASLASGQDSNKLAMMLDDKTFADFTFNVRRREFKVHRNILAAASEVMKTLFICGIDETKKNSADVDCDPEIFAHLVNFIYKDVIPMDEMPEICLELSELAHRYEIKTLKKICIAYINQKKKIDADNALKIFDIAATYEEAQLRERSWNFIKT